MLYHRRKVLLATVEAFGGTLEPIPLQKYLFLISQQQREKSYDFVPYKYGCFSFTANYDLSILEKEGYLAKYGNNITLLQNGFITQLEINDLHAVTCIKKNFGSLSTNKILKYIYTNYPFYAINSNVAKDILTNKEMKKVEEMRSKSNDSLLLTIGYEGFSVERYFEELILNGINVLCDVRKNAYSQKYGFSKAQLEKICYGLGIKYIHVPELGIDSNLRQNLNNQDDYDALFEDYETRIIPENLPALLRVRKLIDSEKRVALTCFEKNPLQCHRTIIAKHLMSMAGANYKFKEILLNDESSNCCQDLSLSIF